MDFIQQGHMIEREELEQKYEYDFMEIEEMWRQEFEKNEKIIRE